MRLKPIENPPTLKMRLVYALSRRRFGKVITPLKVAYARVPAALPIGRAVADYLETGCRLDPALRMLVQAHIAHLNKCTFCIDIGEALALRRGLDQARLRATHAYATDARFNERERAAIAYVDEATRNKQVSDQTFENLRAHFREDEIVEITLLLAIEHYFNLLNLPLGIESDGLCALVPEPTKAAAAAARS